MTQFGSFSFTYGANGNVTSDGRHTYTWDAGGAYVTTPLVVMYAPLRIGSRVWRACCFLACRKGAYIPAKNARRYAPPARSRPFLLADADPSPEGSGPQGEESRIALKILRARFLAEFALSRARSFAALRMTPKGAE
jgi:hypothetical protein